MSDDGATPAPAMPSANVKVAEQQPRALTPAAERALQEAAERRAKQQAAATATPELGGRSGPDPVRYGDWENGGIASDF